MHPGCWGVLGNANRRIAIAAALLASTISVGTASGTPCIAWGCTPNVTFNAVPNGPCVPKSRYNFGVDSVGNTFVCLSIGSWAATPSDHASGHRCAHEEIACLLAGTDGQVLTTLPGVEATRERPDIRPYPARVASHHQVSC